MRRIAFDFLTGLCTCLLAGSALAGNVVLFVGDGMGISTITAARIFAGQQHGLGGEEYELAFERFPNVALIKTYTTDHQVPDSAGTITALLTGTKTKSRFIAVSAEASEERCNDPDVRLDTLVELAERMQYATGIVTTARVTHATPAGAYAHTPQRFWEGDIGLDEDSLDRGCLDLARQLAAFDEGDGLEVILGGGRQFMLPEGVPDPEYPNLTGRRADDRNLIKEWQTASSRRRRYVWNLDQFRSLQPETTLEQYLGLFEPGHMRYSSDRDADVAGEPSLAEMTRFAIRRLQMAEGGYFLLVESGLIDIAHHANNAYHALEETVALSEAVAAALELVDLEQTLILVTADHSHTLSIGGYPLRGNPILGWVTGPDGQPLKDLNGQPYTTLAYANGPGRSQSPAAPADPRHPDYRQAVIYPLSSETHGGEDVAAYAIGLNASAVRGVMEQNELYGVMRQALETLPPPAPAAASDDAHPPPGR